MAHKEALNHHLPGRFYELYGLTEGLMTILDKQDYAAKPESVGSPPPFMEIRVVDENSQDVPAGQVGEIIGRSPLMMPGYYKRPDLTEQAIRDGWLYSGDLGYLDEDGYLYLVDRKKDMIITGGLNVYSTEVERALVRLPGVREAAVTGVPHPDWGEAVVAFVVPDRPDVTAEQIQESARDVLTSYKRPKRVVLVPSLPVTAVGKIDKKELRR